MVRVPTRGPQVVCSAFIEKNGKFLIIFCPRFKAWRVPGGRVEWGERLEETLIREMREETGIIFKNPKFLEWGQDQQFYVKETLETSRLLMFFHVKTNKSPTLNPDVAKEFNWLTFTELKQLDHKEGALSDFFERNPEIEL